jgi:DNA-nicking Smr family endonuclease
MKFRGFDSLTPLKQALQDAERRAAEAARAEAERLARETAERQLFSLTVGPVVPLQTGSLVPPSGPRPLPIPRQRQSDEAAVLVESISDAFDPLSLLETDDSLSYRRAGVGVEVVRKLRRGVWAIQAQVDLHGLRRDAAREQLMAFLREAGGKGIRCVRVVHGKGNGSPGREPVLKAKVKGWLAQKDEVMAFTHARASDGGHGALLVLLRPAGGTPQAAVRRESARR